MICFGHLLISTNPVRNKTKGFDLFTDKNMKSLRESTLFYFDI